MIDLKKSVWPVDALGLLACGLLTAGALSLTVGPIRHERDLLDVRRVDLDSKRQMEQDLSATRDRLQRQLLLARSQVAGHAARLRPLQHLNSRVLEITALIESSGMVIHGSELSPSRRDRWFTAVPLTVNGTGTFPQCARFLHGLHEQMRDIGVAGFRLSGNPAAPHEPARFQFDLLWYAAPGPPGGGDS